MVRDLFAGLDAEDRTIAERWLDEHLAGFSDADTALLRHVGRFVMKLGRLQSVKLTMAEFALSFRGAPQVANSRTSRQTSQPIASTQRM